MCMRAELTKRQETTQRRRRVAAALKITARTADQVSLALQALGDDQATEERVAGILERLAKAGQVIESADGLWSLRIAGTE
jgi:septal ring factor EnvC (AmiA/AmiB activator)